MPESSVVDLTALPAAGTLTLPELPEPRVERRVVLPPWRIACYWAALQANDPLGQGDRDIFPDGLNRVQPLAIDDFADLKRGGLFLLLDLGDEYLALLPLVGEQSMAWFEGEAGELRLVCGTLGTATVAGAVPLLAWATADNLYAACEAVWRLAIEQPLVGHSTRLRRDKHYPRPFEYLGWCSWEQYHANIDADLLAEAIETIEASPIPVRYVLIDDGHVRHRQRRLTALGPDPDKFPAGWAPLTTRRSADGVRWYGLWLNHNGYWNGIDPDNELGELNRHLAPVASGALLPAADPLAALAFYDAFIESARRAGFDFVKVDNQAQNARLYLGGTNPVKAAVNNSRALEAACARHTDGLINCMAHSSLCAINTRVSAVTRCSEDYQLNNAWRAKAHLHNSYANLLWLGQTVWGDHDMFHSNDRFAGRLMAISKALSAAPVYLSDDPREFDPETIGPLCFADGRLLRPLAPAAPLPDSVFADPFHTPVTYRVIAPLPNGAAAIALYNLTEPELPVGGHVSPEDYRHAGALMQDGRLEWEPPAEGLVLYDWAAGEAWPLLRPHLVELPLFGDWLGLLCPIQAGWAVIGRVDKYLSPAGVEVLEATPAELLLRCPEPGPVGVWSATEGLQVLPAEGLLLRVRR